MPHIARIQPIPVEQDQHVRYVKVWIPRGLTADHRAEAHVGLEQGRGAGRGDCVVRKQVQAGYD